MWGLCYDPESSKATILGHFPENQETLNASWVFDDIKAQSINLVTFDTSFVVMLKKFLVEIHKVFWASQMSLVVKNPSASAGDLRDVGSIPGSGKSPGGGNGNLLQYSSHGQRSLVVYSPLGHKESDMAEVFMQLKNALTHKEAFMVKYDASDLF